jgi:hypothetical protein
VAGDSSRGAKGLMQRPGPPSGPRHGGRLGYNLNLAAGDDISILRAPFFKFRTGGEPESSLRRGFVTSSSRPWPPTVRMRRC